MTEVILHAINRKTGKDMAESNDPFTGCTTWSLILDRKTYTGSRIDKDFKYGITIKQWALNNIDKFRNEAQNNPHTLKELQKGTINGWCKACFNRVAEAVGKSDKVI